MSATVFRFGCTYPLEAGCRPLSKAPENSWLNQQRSRAQISWRRFLIGRIAPATPAAHYLSGTLTYSVKEEKAGNGKKQAEVSPKTEYLDNYLSTLLFSTSDPVRQIVLLTDGTDNRPDRLNWPSPSVIFYVSPGHIHDATLKKTTASGSKARISCLLRHVSEDFSADKNDDENWGEKLLRVGYRGDSPSVWLLEMHNDYSDGYLKKILPVASSLLMKDSVFIGTVPATTSEVETKELLRKRFASNGLLVEFKAHWTVDSQRVLERSARQIYDLVHDQPLFLTFFARQLRLSDSQVEHARIQISMAEEEGDEEGFIDAW